MGLLCLTGFAKTIDYHRLNSEKRLLSADDSAGNGSEDVLHLRAGLTPFFVFSCLRDEKSSLPFGRCASRRDSE